MENLSMGVMSQQPDSAIWHSAFPFPLASRRENAHCTLHGCLARRTTGPPSNGNNAELAVWTYSSTVCMSTSLCKERKYHTNESRPCVVLKTLIVVDPFRVVCSNSPPPTTTYLLLLPRPLLPKVTLHTLYTAPSPPAHPCAPPNHSTK